MSKVYVVVEYGGYCKEDEWENIIGVCTTLELADALKNKIENYHDDNECVISREKWNDMWETYYQAGMDTENDSIVNGMVKLFPEFSVKDIELAEALYDDYDNYVGVEIREVDMYTTISEIK